VASSVRVEPLRTAGGRRRFTLVAEQRLAPPPAELFPFFADAHNLERITPPWLHFGVLTPRPIAMAEGTLISYRLRLHGLPLSWLTRITAWDPPHGFVDEQLRGPYRLWRHQHRFEADGAGTLSRDRVDYELRGTDTMQDIAQRLLVARDLTRIFRFRGERLAELFGQPST
jgi:ligand-binding SRPBCC domain-containing protein